MTGTNWRRARWGTQPATHFPPPCSVGYPGRSREWLRPCLFGALSHAPLGGPRANVDKSLARFRPPAADEHHARLRLLVARNVRPRGSGNGLKPMALAEGCPVRVRVSCPRPESVLPDTPGRLVLGRPSSVRPCPPLSIEEDRTGRGRPDVLLAAKIKGNAGFRTLWSVGYGCWVVACVRVHAPVVSSSAAVDAFPLRH